MNITQPFDEVTALFQVADVAFITPLKDGMNLAAKEFVASRKHDGVLILSETAGAAEELRDALLVNPSNPETMVEALHKGLTMRRRELRHRLRQMQQELSTNTVQDWAKDFVTTLNRPVPGSGSTIIRQVIKKQIIKDFRLAKKRLLLLDYDGSLVPFNADYSAATPPKSLVNLLEKLCADIYSDVVLISGRSNDDLEKWFGHLPINLVAEHGATYKRSDDNSWKTIEKVDTKWKQELQPILERYAVLTPGAKLEVKPHSLVWHYRAASPYYAGKYAVIIKKTLRPLLRSYGLELMQGNKVLEVKSQRVDKGAAAMHWLKHHYDFILGIGDDATDENLFSVLPATSDKTRTYGIKIGRGRSLAEYRLTSYRDVLSLLKNLV